MFPHGSQDSNPATSHVAVAVILRPGLRARSWVLIGHRFPAAHLPDLWEFPGGKIEDGEDGAACACREVREETGIEVVVRSHLLDRNYRYHDCVVALEFYFCAYVSGDPHPLGCQAVRWVLPENLDCYPFPDANGPILDALRRHVPL